ncbi:MAG: protease inhibitor I42 family protein [Candidatus Geothermincolia bacterium]
MRKYLGIAALVLVMVLAAGVAAGCSSSKKTTPTTTPAKSSVKTYTEATKNITAKVGETFIIELKSNATTGYQWTITGPLSPAVVKVSNVYVPATTATNTVGSGGVEKWTFKGASTGDALIQMEYLQAGSNTNGGTAVFNVTVK